MLLILLGSVVWSLVMVKSGLVYDYGMGFWGPNGHDGVWHIALIESLSRGSFEMPVFSGQALKNYHIGFDLFLALLHKLTSLPVVSLYFQIVPPVLAFLTGVLTYKFVYLWRKSEREALWATFFVYFGGSFGFLVTLFRDGVLAGESMFWSQQTISTLINPPFALSLVLVLSGLIFILKKKPLLAVLFLGILVQVKVYAAVLVLGGLFIASVFESWKKKKTDLLKIFLGTSLLSFLLFLPFLKTSRGLVVFQPFWYLETMMGLTDRLGWIRFHSAMTTWRMGGVWVKAVPAYLIAFLIFWVGNMGTRILKVGLVFKWLKNVRRIGSVEVLTLSVIVLGTLIPMFFLQAGSPWNTIQFFYYALFFSGVLVGIAWAEILSRLKKSFVRNLAIVVILIFTFPTTIGTLSQFLPSRPPAKISKEELEALEFLKSEPVGVVLTHPFDRVKAKEAEAFPPRPLYLYESSAYVSAFSQKPTYLEDEVNLDITGYPWRERRESIENFYQSLSEEEVRKFLLENNISYVYWIKGQRARLGETQLGLTRIFENSSVDIYKVDK